MQAPGFFEFWIEMKSWGIGAAVSFYSRYPRFWVGIGPLNFALNF